MIRSLRVGRPSRPCVEGKTETREAKRTKLQKMAQLYRLFVFRRVGKQTIYFGPTRDFA
jgi:hypothetical protein